MDRDRMSDRAKAISYLLNELDITKDVAGWLKAMGCKGTRGNGRCCPVANYLNRNLPPVTGKQLHVTPWGSTCWTRGWGEGDEQRTENPGVPNNVSCFIKSFDEGFYPELVAE